MLRKGVRNVYLTSAEELKEMEDNRHVILAT